MAATVSGGVSGNIQTVRTPDTGIFANQPQQFTDNFKCILGSGTIADQGDLRFMKRLTFVASTAQNIALNAATGDDGVVCNFARIRKLFIRVYATVDAASLTIDNAGTANPFTGFLNSAGQVVIPASTSDANAANGIKNSGVYLQTAPNTTGAAVGSGINLRLLPSAHAFSANVEILGCSA